MNRRRFSFRFLYGKDWSRRSFSDLPSVKDEDVGGQVCLRTRGTSRGGNWKHSLI